MRATKFFATILVVIASTLAVFAQTGSTQQPAGVTVSFSTGVEDRYVLTNAVLSYSKPVTQSDLAVTFRNGCTVDLWMSRGFEGTPMNGGTEVDESVACSHHNLSYGVSFFDLAPILAGDGGDIIRPWVELTGKLKKVTPFIHLDGNIITADPKRNSGGDIYGGVRYGFKVAKRMTLNQSANALWARVFDTSRASLNYSASLDIAVHNFTLSPHFRLVAPLGGAQGWDHSAGVTISRSWSGVHF